MEYSLLGRTGVRVSKLALGTYPFGVAPLAKDVDALVGRALELGINVIDTADSYGNQARFDRPGAPPAAERESAEELVGKALKPRGRYDYFLSTKVQEWMYDGPNGGGPGQGGLTRYHIREQVEQSLRRLGTDHIDLLYMHHVDATTPIDETLRALDDLVHQGKVLYLGASTFSGGRLAETLWAADKYGLNAPVVNQVPYNVSTRFVEKDTNAVAIRHDVSLVAFTALDGGLLSGRGILERPPRSGRPWSPEQTALCEQLDDLAHEFGHPTAHVALAWLLSRPGVAMAAMGPETIAELEENVAALECNLTDEQMEMVTNINPLPSFWERLFI